MLLSCSRTSHRSTDRRFFLHNFKMEDIGAYKIFLTHRHLQVFWGKSGDFWQHLWDKFIDFAGKCDDAKRDLE